MQGTVGSILNVLVLLRKGSAEVTSEKPKMHAWPTEGDGVGAHRCGAPEQLQLLRLEVLELKADLDAQIIAQLRGQNKGLEDALNAERASSEMHAEALMGIQRTCDSVVRTCDSRVEDMKMQHARAVARLEDDVAAKVGILQKVKAEHAALTAEIAALKGANAAAVIKFEKEKAALAGQVALLQEQATAKLADIHTAIGALHAFLPPLPPLLLLTSATFDRDWCTVVCGTTWKVDVDAATGMRAHVTENNGGAGSSLTLRGAVPLPRRPPPLLGANGRRQEQLPACRIVVDAYSDKYQWCLLGFLPSHAVYAGAAAAAAIIPGADRQMTEYGGWYIIASSPAEYSDLSHGWTALEPSDDGYATTSKVPPVPAGSAVEFAVDYAAGTCRVAFYTPAAVAGGFVEAPHAKMELRFVAAKAIRAIPARSDPTLRHVDVELYPAATTCDAGAVWRFAS
jgi:hypothetical protein